MTFHTRNPAGATAGLRIVSNSQARDSLEDITAQMKINWIMRRCRVSARQARLILKVSATKRSAEFTPIGDIVGNTLLRLATLSREARRGR